MKKLSVDRQEYKRELPSRRVLGKVPLSTPDNALIINPLRFTNITIDNHLLKWIKL
jgi:hypothetical protein